MGEHAATLVKAWIALLLLLALSAASAWLPLGAWNNAANLGIAVLKALLVALCFMRLARSGPLLRMVALAALGTLALLLVLSGADYLTRNVFRAPWDPPGAAARSTSLGATGGTLPAPHGRNHHRLQLT
jgi:cytochrome c oxidase subunit 4